MIPGHIIVSRLPDDEVLVKWLPDAHSSSLYLSKMLTSLSCVEPSHVYPRSLGILRKPYRKQIIVLAWAMARIYSDP